MYGEWKYRFTTLPRQYKEVTDELHVLAALPPRKIFPNTHCKGGCVYPRACLNTPKKGKIFASAGNQNPFSLSTST
jgi:hypothetical protein